MPRDILSDSLTALRILENDDEEIWPLEDKKDTMTGKLAINRKLSYNKEDCTCYYNYGHGDGTAFLQNQYKTNSLPASSSLHQPSEEVIFSALMISPEDIANQLTLLDLPCFKEIKPEELLTCGWTKLNKAVIAPNVVAFTQRFNRVSFFTVQEILNEKSPKMRGEAIVHFIKVAKRLHELNNLHSMFAVISALQSASIFRLNKSWACLSKKDKQLFDKLAELFSETDNWSAFREYLKNVSLPCIPYLGIFLTDLVYIDIAYPLGSPNRGTKMDVVLGVIGRYQTSDYDILVLPPVANYLNSVRYIEELQKFLEDDQYKLSLKLEPTSPAGSCKGSEESVKECLPNVASGTLTMSPSHRIGTGSLRIHGTFSQSKFIPTHRKCRSLGSNIFGKNHIEDKIDDKTPAGSVNLLDDTLLESPGSVANDKMAALLKGIENAESSDNGYQSFVRRKTILKEGKKPTLASWQRYWIQICGNTLIFYSSKSFKGTTRNDFKREHCKAMCLDGWLAVRTDDDKEVFQLLNHNLATLYKFKTRSDEAAYHWVLKIAEVTNKSVKPLPANLMSFE